jgi:uncharacterized small protein (DUF1192 family)
MNEDDLPLSLRNANRGVLALAGLMKEDLDPYSVEELSERVAALEGEIARAKEAIDRKKNRLSAAEALFSFKGS